MPLWVFKYIIVYTEQHIFTTFFHLIVNYYNYSYHCMHLENNQMHIAFWTTLPQVSWSSEKGQEPDMIQSRMLVDIPAVCIIHTASTLISNGKEMVCVYILHHINFRDILN